MSISVIIPAYRAARTIRRAISSVLEQTIAPHEILVVDDGSPDGAELTEAISSFGTLVTLLVKPNGGASSARNHGIEHARCEWVAFLDADDYWEPNKLEMQLEIAATHPDVAVIGCRWYEEVPGEVRTPAELANERFCGRTLNLRGHAAFEVACSIWTGSLLVRRSALDDEKFITGLEPAEDRDLWVRLVGSHPTYILPDLLATYVQEPGGISRTDINRDCGNMLKVVYRHAELLGPVMLRKQEALVHRRWAGVLLAQRLPSDAFPHALQRLKLQPACAQAWWAVLKSSAGMLTDRLLKAPVPAPRS